MSSCLNNCDCCLMEDSSECLIWIDSEDFKPLKKDNFNSIKHQECIEIFCYSALCYDCYLKNCCGDLYDKELKKIGVLKE